MFDPKTALRAAFAASVLLLAAAAKAQLPPPPVSPAKPMGRLGGSGLHMKEAATARRSAVLATLLLLVMLVMAGAAHGQTYRRAISPQPDWVHNPFSDFRSTATPGRCTPDPPLSLRRGQEPEPVAHAVSDYVAAFCTDVSACQRMETTFLGQCVDTSLASHGTYECLFRKDVIFDPSLPACPSNMPPQTNYSLTETIRLTKICDTNVAWFDKASLACVCYQSDHVYVPAIQQCVPKVEHYGDKCPPGQCCPSSPDPVQVLNGSKFLNIELKVSGIPLRLSYSSKVNLPGFNAGEATPQPSSHGSLWSSSQHRWMRNIQGGSGKSTFVFDRGGHRVTFSDYAAALDYRPDADVKDQTLVVNGVRYYRDQQALSMEGYNSVQEHSSSASYIGQVQSVAYVDGRKLTMTYSTAATPPAVAPAPGLLLQAADSFGRSIGFTYEAAPAAPGARVNTTRVKTLVDEAGASTQFEYAAAGNLQRIVWPDGESRTFLYESPLSWAVTGVVDERGLRTATFDYDAEGRATGTERAGGVSRHTFSWATPPRWEIAETYDSAKQAVLRRYVLESPGLTTWTQPNGQALQFDSATLLGTARPTAQSQPAGSGCAASSKSLAYDANGNVEREDDFSGNRVCRAFDNRNLETVRIEGLPTTQACAPMLTAGATLPIGARKISTAWHPVWRLPTRIAEPGRLTTKTYNGQGASCSSGVLPDTSAIAVVCQKVEQGTTDANGAQGFNASPQTGVANRVWSYTYNQHGQVLTEKGPRHASGAINTVTYTYHPATTTDVTMGDLASTSNAKGQVTRYTQYDKHGNWLASTDPNGVITTRTFDLRQRLKTVQVGTRLTTYDYDAAGQLKKITRPDASWIGYDWDDAHRQVAVYDSRGNRIDYVLDNAGNRTGENVKDPSGALKRTLARTVDALNRVDSLTGRN